MKTHAQHEYERSVLGNHLLMVFQETYQDPTERQEVIDEAIRALKIVRRDMRVGNRINKQ